MAKKGGVNRTEKVREYMLANPDQTNAEAFRGLEAQGTHVSHSLISQVRKQMGFPQGGSTKKRAGKKKAKKKVGQKKTSMAQPASAPTARGRAITAEDLFEAKKLADDLGGLERVREALDALERLR